MRANRLLLTLTIAALVATTPYTADAAGRGGMGHRRGFRGPVIGFVAPQTVFVAPHLGFVAPRVIVAPHLAVVSPFRGPRRFVPFIGGFGLDDVEVVLVPVGVWAGSEPFVAPPPPPAPVPEPQILFPPPPQSPPSPARMHTVIVQHGAKIEVQQVPE